jgi:hypothetical protein
MLIRKMVHEKVIGIGTGKKIVGIGMVGRAILERGGARGVLRIRVLAIPARVMAAALIVTAVIPVTEVAATTIGDCDAERIAETQLNPLEEADMAMLIDPNEIIVPAAAPNPNDQAPQIATTPEKGMLRGTGAKVIRRTSATNPQKTKNKSSEPNRCRPSRNLGYARPSYAVVRS